MLLGLISDTHDHLINIGKAMKIFHDNSVELVIHAGDLVSPPAVMALAGLPIAGILGNNDGEQYGVAKAFNAIGGKFDGAFLEIETTEGKLAVYHGTVAAIKTALIQSGIYFAVICGHTHLPENHREGNTWVLNPGTAHGFDKQSTVMIFNTVEGKATLIEL